ncbi:MAG TPA: chemotaxis-specific protein-glutamate methyltransferase CheB [Anaeromyxobacter sp.]|nr:chemotaxis-specific protein-glutamate methyltransferase CheB [Anaeromyxobacter sp.]
MKRIRVLVVDDSAAIRRLLAEAVAASEDLEICGSAQNGQVALDRLDQASPDVVTMDVEMPVMDGISAVRALRSRRPRLPVLMFSSHTQRGALATLDALAAGASDFVAKPRVVGLGEARSFVEGEVLPRLRALGGRALEGRAVPQAAPPPAQLARRSPATLLAQQYAEAVVVGVSTGGPQALASLLPALPAALPTPVLVVQHMPALFTRILAERLAALGPNPVREAEHNMPVEPGYVYLARGGLHLRVSREGRLLQLDDGPPENSCRPAVDPLFRSAADVWKEKLLAVVLTGMGRDGCAGAAHVRERGGMVIAQDRESSVVWGMPGAVVQAGLAHLELSVAEIAGEIARRARIGPHPGGARP